MSESQATVGAAEEGAIRSPRSCAPPDLPRCTNGMHALLLAPPGEEQEAGVPIADKERFFAQMSHEVRTVVAPAGSGNSLFRQSSCSLPALV